MCNLYRTDVTAADIAKAFGATMPVNFNAADGDIFKGGRGMVVREVGGARVVEAMTWGYPLRLKKMKPGSKPIPVNNIADVGKYPWTLFAGQPERRCIIPVTRFAEAEGPDGAKTRTWFALKDRPVFAWAGMWDDSDEWGRWYSGLMTDANAFVAPVHDRMPVLLHEDDYDRWLHGSLSDVKAFQARVFPPELMTIDRTSELWVRRRSSASAA